MQVAVQPFPQVPVQVPLHPPEHPPVQPLVQPEPHPEVHEPPQEPQEDPQELEQEPVHPPVQTEPHPATHKPEQEPLQLEEELLIGSDSRTAKSSSALSNNLSTVSLIAAKELSSIKSWISNNKSLIFSICGRITSFETEISGRSSILSAKEPMRFLRENSALILSLIWLILSPKFDILDSSFFIISLFFF